MNKNMNIIDLANKLRNPIQMPKRVKHKDTIYTYDAQRNNYYYCDHQIYISTCLKDILNDEVEILEDNTEEIEEYNIDENGFIHTKCGAWQGRKLDLELVYKINELVRRINYIERKINEN